MNKNNSILLEAYKAVICLEKISYNEWEDLNHKVEKLEKKLSMSPEEVEIWENRYQKNKAAAEAVEQAARKKAAAFNKKLVKGGVATLGIAGATYGGVKYMKARNRAKEELEGKKE